MHFESPRGSSAYDRNAYFRTPRTSAATAASPRRAAPRSDFATVGEKDAIFTGYAHPSAPGHARAKTVEAALVAHRREAGHWDKLGAYRAEYAKSGYVRVENFDSPRLHRETLAALVRTRAIGATPHETQSLVARATPSRSTQPRTGSRPARDVPPPPPPNSAPRGEGSGPAGNDVPRFP